MAFWRNLGVKQVSIGGFKGLYESVSPAARPLGALSACSNMVIDEAPALSTRTGLTLLGTAGTGAVNGLYEYHNLAGTTVQPIRHVGTTLARYASGSWTSITSAMADAKSTAVMLNDTLCIFTGSTAKSWNGTTYGNLAGAPAGKYVCEAHEQLFVTGIATREGDIDFCDVSAPTSWTPSATNNAGSVKMSVYPGKWIAHDAERDKVLFWTTEALHFLIGPETANRPDLWENRFVASVGTVNGRTVQNMKGVWVWLTRVGGQGAFAFWSGGGIPDTESDAIRDSLALIDWANIDNAGSFLDERGRYVCDCPKTGGGNIRFMFDASQGWLTGDGPDIRSYAQLTISGVKVPVVGDDGGKVYQVTGTDDAGTAISYSAEMGPSVLGDAFHKKEVLEIIPVMTKASEATASLALSTAESGTYETAKTLTVGTTLTYEQVPLPVATGGSQLSTVWRLRISGTGVVTIHDVLIRYREVG